MNFYKWWKRQSAGITLTGRDLLLIGEGFRMGWYAREDEYSRQVERAKMRALPPLPKRKVENADV